MTDLRTDEIRTRITREAVRRLAGRRAVALDLADIAAASGTDPELAGKSFPGEWDLLTALVLDAYSAMSDSAEAASAAAVAEGASPIEHWTAICLGVRRWALDHPDEYALIWGQPVPGYSAPPETMAAGARTVLALLGVLHKAREDGRLNSHDDDPALSAGMRANVSALAEGLLNGLPEPVIARMLVAWTQLHGMVAFDVYGHIAGVAADPEAFFTYAAAGMGAYVGLPR
ncbi:TetR-like C-terminal domain-containing protein [Streptomyces sp. NPDC005576]|uniref:TetR-like C-terminal domain-containing protein n=1 Tax=unclassified Streptomyces TaxID=2593676 RepID=UPI0033C386AE